MRLRKQIVAPKCAETIVLPTSLEPYQPACAVTTLLSTSYWSHITHPRLCTTEERSRRGRHSCGLDVHSQDQLNESSTNPAFSGISSVIYLFDTIGWTGTKDEVLETTEQRKEIAWPCRKFLSRQRLVNNEGQITQSLDHSNEAQE